MSSWSLGIDFGTSYTVAAIADEGQSRTIDVESNGRDRMPSATFLTAEGEVLVGTAAQHQATFAPDRYEPTPKRAFGERAVFLGDGLIDVAELAGAVLRKVYTEACRQQGERTPERLFLTYPADWSDARRGVLLEASERGGLPKPELIAEPVAAAIKIAYQVTPPGRHIAVYDYGGGTFDAAVLLRTATGFEVAGPPVGRDPLGGEDIDLRIIGYLGDLLAEEYGERWQMLLTPPDLDARRDAADLRSEVQRAKETLSEANSCQLWVPGIKRDIQLTRRELDELIRDDVRATIDALETALEEASIAASELAGIYLVGGSSRIPLVAEMLWERLKVRPAVQDNPKSVVATGAASSAQPARRPGGAPGGGGLLLRPRLAVAYSEAAGDRCLGQLVLERAGATPLVVRAHDEPARGSDTGGLARAALKAQSGRTPGFREEATSPVAFGGHEGIERRFVVAADGSPLMMLEHYLVLDGRALVVNAPEQARALAEAIGLAEQGARNGSFFQLRFQVEVPPDFGAIERVRLSPGGTRHSVVAERFLLPASDPPAAWKHREIDALMRRPAAKLALRSAVRLFGAVAGEIVTITWRDEAGPMITKKGLATFEREAYALTITLPHAEQQLFPALAERVFLHDAPPAG